MSTLQIALVAANCFTLGLIVGMLFARWCYTGKLF